LSSQSPDQLITEYLLRLGDDRLILGHRLSEWCGRAPMLEEDIALANIALDCIGQARNFLEAAAISEKKGRTADSLVYFREAVDFRNLLLVEQPNGDFAATVARQFLVDAYTSILYEELSDSNFVPLKEILGKASKEVRYHLRHSSGWMVRLGDGTEESHQRLQKGLEHHWKFTGQLFASDTVDRALASQGIGVALETLREPWMDLITRVCSEATLTIPTAIALPEKFGKRGYHSEHLGHLLAEMQSVARSIPGATW
jgi:ring-1,2-phenylacetyl-CoA epoxidase subunit PaaC